MNPHTFRAETPLQALRLEQALLRAKERETTADAAPDGQELSRVAALAVPAARERARRAVEAAWQTQADAAEKKGARPRLPLRPAPVGRGPRRAVDGLANCFAERADYLGYADRLASGRSMGSGLVEGACQQGIGRRRKQTGARWTIRRANRMATLCCTLHGDAWDACWKHALS